MVIIDVVLVVIACSLLITWYLVARVIPVGREEIRKRHGLLGINRPELNEVERLFHESEGPAAVERRNRELNWGPSNEPLRKSA